MLQHDSVDTDDSRNVPQCIMKLHGELKCQFLPLKWSPTSLA